MRILSAGLPVVVMVALTACDDGEPEQVVGAPEVDVEGCAIVDILDDGVRTDRQIIRYECPDGTTRELKR